MKRIDPLRESVRVPVSERPVDISPKSKPTASDDSVIAQVTPDVRNAEGADQLLRKIVRDLPDTPRDQAVEAQAGLDEERVRALLED